MALRVSIPFPSREFLVVAGEWKGELEAGGKDG
jgi:hypothetical protein